METIITSKHALFTIGHSNHSFERFLELLRGSGVEVLVDVRSQPYSKYTPYFDSDQLAKTLPPAGMKYLSFGEELGGQPDNPGFYDAGGHVVYARMAFSPDFLAGIERLAKGACKFRVALPCGEEDPTNCHRRLLVARVMGERGFEIAHIREHGRLQPEHELVREEQQRNASTTQLGMFEIPEEERWRSTRSALRKRPQPNSSER